jgi:hypothetical protein
MVTSSAAATGLQQADATAVPVTVENAPVMFPSLQHGSVGRTRRTRSLVVHIIVLVAGALVVISCARERTTIPGSQTVLIHLKLSDGGSGTPADASAMHALASHLDAKTKQTQVGRFETATFRDGECVLIMYGPSADSLYATIEPELRASSLSRGGWVIKRYGNAQDRNARTVRVEL